MTTKQEYNGYTNYETWNCALWLDNDQGTSELMQEEATKLVEAMVNPHDPDEVAGTTSLLADFIKDLIDEQEENSNLPENGMFRDILNAALREIDYYDIAESQIADALRERQENEPQAKVG